MPFIWVGSLFADPVPSCCGISLGPGTRMLSGDDPARRGRGEGRVQGRLCWLFGLQAASPQNAVRPTGQACSWRLLLAGARWMGSPQAVPRGACVAFASDKVPVCRRVFFKECAIESPGLLWG